MSCITFQTMDVDGISTRFIDVGSGPGTIILIGPGVYNSGGVCWNSMVWEPLLERLQDDFRLIAFDTYGQGGSRPLPAAFELTYDAVVRHAMSFVSAVAPRAVHLVGHDQGALIALHVACSPDIEVSSCTLVNAATLICPPGEDVDMFLDGRQPVPLYEAISQEWVLDQLSLNHEHINSGRFLSEAVSLAHAHRTLPVAAEKWTGELLPTLRSHRASIYRAVQERALALPTLSLWGSQDPACPVSYGKALFDLLSPTHRGTQLRLMNRSGYLPYREQADLFAAHLRGFVKASIPA